MKVDCELDAEETTALLLTLGHSTGIYVLEGRMVLAKACVRLTNKLLARSANFVPYDENNFDPKRKGFPFAPAKRQ